MLFIESILIQLFLSVLPYEIQMLMNVFLILLVYVVNWRVFLKAGEKGWKSLIPFYNEYVQYKFLKMKADIVKAISDLYRVVLILQFCIVPVSIMFANIKNIFVTVFTTLILILMVLAIVYIDFTSCSRLATSFGRGKKFAWGIFIFRFLFTTIIAFDKSEFKTPQNELRIK
mgnify:CR=1 FL=1